MDKSDVIAKLKEAKPTLANKYGLTTLALFGSYSRDEQTLESDIDLMLDFEPIIARNFFNCAYELEDLFAGKRVQMVMRDGIKPRYFEAIKTDLIYA